MLKSGGNGGDFSRKRLILRVVNVDESAGRLKMSVSDTGVGIPKEKRGELFKRFMQSNFSGDSVGVGLHLTHELVNVHKGTITYEENPGGGSIFIVTLPTDKSVYEEKDFLVPNNVLLREEEMAEKHLADVVLGMFTAFLVSVLVIRFLMDYIRKHDFKPFGWYRIVLGILVLVYFGIGA